MKLTVKKLRNGSLYYNTKSQQVERVLGTLNSNRVWTTSHEKPAQANQVKRLRFATKSEVEDYLQESENASVPEISRFLPPLPVPQ